MSSRYRTPLRYPGGKQRLSPFIAELLRQNGVVGGHYVEPYAGGAGVAWELLLEGQVAHVHLNDSSLPIYAFWNAVLSNTERLCQLISRASLTVEEWKKRREIVRHPEGFEEIEVAFSAFFLNRCNRSGVLSGGLIGGLAQNGRWNMDARFPRAGLINRIEAIASRRHAVTLRNWDAERFIEEYVPNLPVNSFVYCDPPYYHKASRLYLDHYNKGDHARIAQVIQEKLRHKWVVSYDAAPEIVELYRGRKTFVYDLQYNASRVYKGREVFVFADEVTVPRGSSLPFIDQALKAHQEDVQRAMLAASPEP